MLACTNEFACVHACLRARLRLRVLPFACVHACANAFACACVRVSVGDGERAAESEPRRILNRFNLCLNRFCNATFLDLSSLCIDTPDTVSYQILEDSC